MNRVAQRTVRTLMILSIVFVGAAFASDYDVDWYTIGGGDMFSSGDDYELSGTSGQPEAGVMTGGTFELAGGFWPGAVEESFCFGDLDDDGDVNLADLAQLLSNYGTTSGATYEDGDLDGDGDVDLADLAALLAVYGTTCP